MHTNQPSVLAQTSKLKTSKGVWLIFAEDDLLWIIILLKLVWTVSLTRVKPHHGQTTPLCLLWFLGPISLMFVCIPGSSLHIYMCNKNNCLWKHTHKNKILRHLINFENKYEKPFKLSAWVISLSVTDRVSVLSAEGIIKCNVFVVIARAKLIWS